MRSWFESGAAAGSGVRVPSTFLPSRLKMRISSPPASARRARTGRSRRQSDDQSSEITRILAGEILRAARVLHVLVEGHALGEAFRRDGALGHGPLLALVVLVGALHLE